MIFTRTAGLVFNNFGNFSRSKIWNTQASNFSLAPYFKVFGTSQFEFAMVNLYYFKVIFTKKQIMFRPLTGASLRKQRNLLMFFTILLI